MNEVPEEGRDATDAGRANGRAGRKCLRGLTSASHPFSAGRKGVSPEPTRPTETNRDGVASRPANARRREISERPATSRSASSGGPAASGAGRASRPDGSETTGGAVMRFAVGAASCGALGCRRSEQLVAVELEDERRVLCLAHARRWVR